MKRIFNRILINSKKNLRSRKVNLLNMELNDQKDYSKIDLKSQYIKLTKKYHPDISKSDNTKFEKIKSSYENLIKEFDFEKNKVNKKKTANYYSDVYSQKFQKEDYINYEEKKKHFEKTKKKIKKNNSQFNPESIFFPFIIFLLCFKFLMIKKSYENGNFIDESSKIVILKKRKVKTLNMEEFTVDELDKYSTDELLYFEQMGIKKIPDEIFEDILDLNDVVDNY